MGVADSAASDQPACVVDHEVQGEPPLAALRRVCREALGREEELRVFCAEPGHVVPRDLKAKGGEQGRDLPSAACPNNC